VKRATPLIAVIALCGAAAACTPEEVGLWQEWHQQDPAAAEQFANSLQGGSGQSGGSGGDNNQPGDCDSYRDDMAAVGLPVDTFVNIAWRESRCNPNSRVIDDNDTGGGLFGFNFRGSLAGYWDDLCGLTWDNLTSSVDRQMRCAKAAYDQLGLQPWSGSA
jgi:hypothetical protein